MPTPRLSVALGRLAKQTPKDDALTQAIVSSPPGLSGQATIQVTGLQATGNLSGSFPLAQGDSVWVKKAADGSRVVVGPA